MEFFDFNNSGDQLPNDKKFARFVVHNGQISGVTISAELAKRAGLRTNDRVLLGYDAADKKFGIMKTRRDDFAGCELRSAATNSNTLRTIGAMPFFRHHPDIPIITERMPGLIENDNGKMIYFHCDPEKSAEFERQTKPPAVAKIKCNFRLDEKIMNRFRSIVKRRRWSATLERLIADFLARNETNEEPQEIEEQDDDLYMKTLEDAAEEID